MSTGSTGSRGFTDRWNAGRAAGAAAEAAAGQGKPLDHAHLSRYTLGDRSLELEILDLFLGEAPRTLARIEALASSGAAGDAKDWHAACHTLKGSARAVGAVDVAVAAEAAEKETDRSAERLKQHARSIAAAVTVVSDYIAAWRVAA